MYAKRFRTDEGSVGRGENFGVGGGTHKVAASPVVHVSLQSRNAVEEDMAAAVQKFGDIAYIMMMHTRGQALIEFKDIESSRRCVEFAARNPIYVAGQPALFNYSTSNKIRRPESDDQPNRILLITVLNPLYPITVDVVNKICSPHGKVLRIVIFKKSGVQAMVEFSRVEEATAAKEGLHGCDIYSGCCTLKITFAKPSITKLNVFKNDQETYDYEAPALSALDPELCSIRERRTLLTEPPSAAAMMAAGRPGGRDVPYNGPADPLSLPGVGRSVGGGGVGSEAGGGGAVGGGDLGAMGRNSSLEADLAGLRELRAAELEMAELRALRAAAANAGVGPADLSAAASAGGGGGGGNAGYGPLPGAGGGDMLGNSAGGGVGGGGLLDGPGGGGGGGGGRPAFGYGGGGGPPRRGGAVPFGGGPMKAGPGGGGGPGYQRPAFGGGPVGGPQHQQYGGRPAFGGGPPEPPVGSLAFAPPTACTVSQEGCVLLVHGLHRERVNCERVFNLFCLFGNVVRVKFLRTKEGCAMVQMGDRPGRDRALHFLSGVHLFGGRLGIAESKQPVIRDVPNPYQLFDGSPSFRDFMGNRWNRFSNPMTAAKNRILAPSRTLHFYNVPADFTEQQLGDVFVRAGAAQPPNKIKFFTTRGGAGGGMGGSSASGLVEWENRAEAIDALVYTNHVTIDNPNGKYPFTFKLAFSEAPIRDVPPFGGGGGGPHQTSTQSAASNPSSASSSGSTHQSSASSSAAPAPGAAVTNASAAAEFSVKSE